MILSRDGLVELEYEVRYDILSVTWPDLVDASTAEINHTFKLLIDTINHYHITKLLIDSSKSKITIPDEEYKPLLFELSRQLSKTSLKKVARVLSADSFRESKLTRYAEEITAKITFSTQSQTFTDIKSAQTWLIAN